MTPTKRTTALAALLAVLTVAGSACLITQPDGSVVSCDQVTEWYWHRGHINKLHRHSRTTWRCTPVSGPTSTTTTAPKASPTVAITSVSTDPGGRYVTVDFHVTDPDTPLDRLTYAYRRDTTVAAPTVTALGPGDLRAVFDLHCLDTATLTVEVTDPDGLHASAAYDWALVAPGATESSTVTAAC